MFTNDTIFILFLVLVIWILFESSAKPENMNDTLVPTDPNNYSVPPLPLINTGFIQPAMASVLSVNQINSINGGFMDISLNEGPRIPPSIPSLKQKLLDHDGKFNEIGSVIETVVDFDGNKVRNVRANNIKANTIGASIGNFNEINLDKVSLKDKLNQMDIKGESLENYAKNKNRFDAISGNSAQFDRLNVGSEDITDYISKKNTNGNFNTLKTKSLGGNDFLFVNKGDNTTNISNALSDVGYSSSHVINISDNLQSQYANYNTLGPNADANTSFIAVCPNGYYQVGIKYDAAENSTTKRYYPICKKLN
jgi:hypothetical protein